MRKIDKMLSNAKYKALIDKEPRRREAIKEAMGRMSTEQLEELANGEPSEKRLKEIFASVGGLHLLESG